MWRGGVVRKEVGPLLRSVSGAPDTEFDFAVVGAGIVGSWTARELTKHGRVLLLEQFREPHTRGSSHGRSRIIRSSYVQPFFAEMMPHSFRMWRQAESEMNEKLIETTGGLYIADSPENEKLQSVIKNMKKFSPELSAELTGKDIKMKYPKTLKYDMGVACLFDKSAGIVLADKSVQTIQRWFQASGGTFWDSFQVTQIMPSDSKITIKTNKKNVTAKSIVVTAGPWTQKVLGSLSARLPLEPQAVKAYYFKEKEPGAYSASSGFPVVLGFMRPSIYAIPSHEYPGLMKVCIHAGVPCDPDGRDQAPENKQLLSLLQDHIKEHFPLLESEPAVVEPCMYTCTPDEIFVIDKLPGHKNIALGAGFSGTGFKTAPVVGRLLSELARGVEPFLDLSPYRLSRFSK